MYVKIVTCIPDMVNLVDVKGVILLKKDFEEVSVLTKSAGIVSQTVFLQMMKPNVSSSLNSHLSKGLTNMTSARCLRC